jgi:transposase-like protein
MIEIVRVLRSSIWGDQRHARPIEPNDRPDRFLPKPHARCHLDKMVISISGRQMHLLRAVDGEGEVLELLGSVPAR